MYFYLVIERELYFVLCFVVAIISGQWSQKNEQAICNNYNIPGVSWTCKRIQECRWSANIINTAQERRCGSDKYVVKICCPEMTTTTKPTSKPISKPTLKPTPKPTHKPTTTSAAPARKNYLQIIRQKCVDYSEARYFNICVGGQVFGQVEKCGIQMDCRQTVEVLVTGGTDAEPKEFPHMALVGFGNNVDSITWACGGSLISESFVLSAAHCTNPNSILGQVRWVALGFLARDYLKPDKLNENIFSVAKTFNHPKYQSSHADYDIALYQLRKPVEFTPFIRPICLHTENSVPPEAANNATITGWGLVEIGGDVSEKLQKAAVRILPEDSCVNQYASEQKLRNGFDGKLMVCAGDEYSNKDTCTGDSGGPIQINHKEKCMYIQIGVTSLGSSFCGDGTPAIYTRVFAYLEWIQKTVWPNGV